MLLLFSGTLTFAAPDTARTGLTSLISAALSNNPGIAAAQKAAAAAAVKIKAAPIPPDPELMVESMNNPAGSVMDSTTQGTEISLTQMIPFPGKLNAALKKQQADAVIASESYKMKQADVQKDVALMYYGIASMDASLAIENQKQKQLEAMGAVVAAQYTGGKASLSEYIRTNNMKAMAQTEILDMQAQRARMIAELSAMFGGPIPKDTVFAYNLSPLIKIPSENEILTAARDRFPEIRMKQAMENSAEAEREQMKLEVAPDFMLKGTLDLMASGDKTYSLGISVPLPLFLSSKQIPLAEAAGLMSDGATQERRDTENMVTQEVQSRYAALTKANETFILYQSTIQRSSEQAFNIALKDYAVNRIDFNELIDSFQNYYDASLSLEKTKQLLMEQRVYLDYYTGNTLHWEEKS
jgi:Outer membrane protein